MHPSARTTAARRTLRAALSVTLVAGFALATSTEQAAAAQPDPADSHRITLVTGDVVVATPRPGGGYDTVATPAEGRTVGFTTTTDRGRVSVVPEDVAPLITAGSVDPRLFDVSLLVESGLDDTGSADIPVIAQRAERGRAGSLGTARAGRHLAPIDADVLAVSKKDARANWKARRDVRKLWLDLPFKPAAAQSVPASWPTPATGDVNAPVAWGQGLTGAGVTVAVLDTGVDVNHPDLAGVVTQDANFSSEPGLGTSPLHGTAMVGLVAGSGAASGGVYKGVAPDAKVALGKICQTVSGEQKCSESQAVDATAWAVDTAHASIVNMSFGGDYSPSAPSPLLDTIASYCDRALFTIAAGNYGENSFVESPAVTPCALTVGAADRSGGMAVYSPGRGVLGSPTVKPDVLAPGYDVVVTGAAGAPLDANYSNSGGTSSAAAITAGAAALLKQKFPSYNAKVLKSLLIGTAAPNTAPLIRQGAGRIDLGRAVTQSVVPGAFDTRDVALAHPHPAGQSTTRSIPLRNNSSSAVTLDATADFAAVDGTPAPGLVTIGNPSLTINAGATVSVQAVVHGDVAPVGWYRGVVTARTADGSVVARTVLSVDVRPELHTATVTLLDRTGAPVPRERTDLRLHRLDKAVDDNAIQPVSPSVGVLGRALEPGDYALTGTINSDLACPTCRTHVFKAIHVRTTDVSVTVDERTARRALPRTDTSATDFRIGGYGVGHPASGWSSLTVQDGENAQVVPDPDPGGLDYLAWGTYVSGTTTYRLADFRTGSGVPGDTGAVVAKASMAHVTNSLGRAGRPVGTKVWLVPQIATGYYTMKFRVDPPATGALVEESYFSPGQWGAVATVLDAANHRYDIRGPVVALTAGQVAQDRWNHPVFSPDVPTCAVGVSVSCGPVRPFTDAPGHVLVDPGTTGTITLSRNGVQIGSTDLATAATSTPAVVVPVGAANYQLRADVTRPHWPLSTAVDATWGFGSSGPLLTPRIVPGSADATGGVPRSMPMDLTVEFPAGTALTGGTVQVSYDDGATWQLVPSFAGGATIDAPLVNPASPGYVAVKVTATDATRSVVLTVKRAYEVL
ncbi:S8 family serine peptidase [Actinosynnema sp. NPDC020468]|uniref:S8 family peptidase n=1 Tax=Actinosynnema sp. NPDC020468 TaxID=3154488 RepID=UPI0033EE183F